MSWNTRVMDKIKEEYRFETSLKTLRSGKLIAAAGVIVVAYFAYMDYSMLDLYNCLHWRALSWVGFAIFLLGSFTFLRKNLKLIIPFYAIALSGVLVMMTGMIHSIFVLNGTQDQKVAVIVGFMSVWFILALIGIGARKYLLLTSIAIFVPLIYTFTQIAEQDKGFIISIILVGIFSNIMMYLQEKGDYERFQFIRRLEINKNTLSNQKSELEILNKELESFNYSISHDLRTPLRIANSYAQLLERNLEHTKEEDTKEYLDFITSSIRKMSHLINDLLQFI